MKLTLFTEELRECLNAAGLSDCGENDEWNYWYQRLLKAHSESVERQTMTEVAENAKLRELVEDMYKAFMHGNCYRWCEFKEPCNYISDGRCQWYDRMRELGVDA